MGTAYTPGLRVSDRTAIRKVRRLPLKGEVLVSVGDHVEPDTEVARTELPGVMQTIRLAERMGVDPQAALAALRVKVGDRVAVDDLLAETPGLFGKYFKSRFLSPVAGTVELISPTTGHLGIREQPTPVTREAYVRGTVVEVMPQEGVAIACTGAFIQGIFGVAGERKGEIAMAVGSPKEPLEPGSLRSEHRDKVVVGGSTATAAALRQAAQVGVAAIVCGGIVDLDLINYMAESLHQPDFDIGVAITGHEPLPFTLVLTEGFGDISMAARTFSLFQSLQGKLASVNGATQIRAGVIRPEVVVPLAEAPEAGALDGTEGGELAVGAPIRLIREPYFGRLGTVSAMPNEPVTVESGAVVRVLEARLQEGEVVTTPRANVELIETG